MKIEFDITDEDDRKAAEDLFDKFSSPHTMYYAIPGYLNNPPNAVTAVNKMLSKQLFLFALQSVHVVNT